MLSIIIPTLNEERYLPILLETLRNQTFQKFEVIVADAESTDRTKEIARTYNCTVVQGGVISVGRNNGAKVANNDILLFLDADVAFDSEFIEDSINEMTEKNLDIAIPLFNSSEQSLSAKILYSLSDFSKKITAKRKGKFATSQCLFIRRAIFKEIGGFNQDRIIGEDVDFMKRLSRINPKYGLLKSKIIASDRRFSQTGALTVVLASIFFSILVVFGIRNKRLQQFGEKIYGGWGKW